MTNIAMNEKKTTYKLLKYALFHLEMDRYRNYFRLCRGIELMKNSNRCQN